jgi:hypothetical protein
MLPIALIGKVHWMFQLNKRGLRGTAQSQIDIKQVCDDILELPTGRYRSIYEVSSVNFELKSEAEQDILIDQYKDVLHSLACPIQILIRVRALDVDNYLEEILLKHNNEQDSVYKEQLATYVQFVKSLVSSNQILSRRFYVVVPYDSTSADLRVVNEQLALLGDGLVKSFARLGMSAKRLHTIEILDLFYQFYCPDHAKRQPLTHQAMKLAPMHITQAVME